MPRLLFEKKGKAVWISHLDLMRLFQRSFKRAGLPLTHTQGFNPRPSVSIALPLSVGIESDCELLDFDLDGEKIANEEILARLNQTLIEGVKVLCVYDDPQKIKNLAFLDCEITMEYDNKVPDNAVEKITELLNRTEVLVVKKNKNGVSEQNIIPMIRSFTVAKQDEGIINIQAKVCCQNPSLNPMQIHAAITSYLPEFAPNFVTFRRNEIYDLQENVFR